jgi:hypothetical protein
MRLPRISPWIAGVLVFAVASLVFSLYFKGLMLTPNLKAPTFGGDGLTIHYNLQYHAAYGEGAYLDAQYFPHQESIFMTDAQALVAVIMAWLRPVFPGLSDYATGISNVLIFWSNPLAALLLFLILRRVGVRWPLALIGGCLIAMLSPQILRQLGGQYTLGFTFLLPLLVWYQLTYNKGKRYWLKSLAVAAVVILVGINNPYLYAVSIGLLLGSAGAGILLRFFERTRLPWQQLLSWIVVSLLATVAIFLTLHHFDQVEDRVRVPFGFFKNIASWGGLLSDQSTFPYEGVRAVLPGLKEPFRENRIYMGLVPICFIIAGLFVMLVPAWRKKYLKEVPARLLVLLAGVLPGLIFAFGLPFIHVEEWTYEHLGSILQFRAPVRFGWPAFYLAGIVAVYGLHLIYERGKAWWRIILVALTLVLWMVEAHQFLLGSLDDHLGPNAFTPSALDQQRTMAATLGIDTATFSSIYLLPTENGWSDKIHQPGSWRSNHDGYKLSLATSLPLLNGKLSRVSLDWVLRSLQIVSHPLIEKPLLDEIPADKDILLLASAENELARREMELLAVADTLLSNEQLILARISPAALRQRTDKARRIAAADTTANTPLLRFAPDNTTDRAFFGKGSRLVQPGWTDLHTFPADTLQLNKLTNEVSAEYELSLWAFADKSRFGGPKFYLRQLDVTGKRLREDKFWTNQTYDAQRGWLRIGIDFTPLPEATSFVLVGEYEFAYWIDEVWVQRQGKHARIGGTEDGYLYDNYRIGR